MHNGSLGHKKFQGHHELCKLVLCWVVIWDLSGDVEKKRPHMHEKAFRWFSGFSLRLVFITSMCREQAI